MPKRLALAVLGLVLVTAAWAQESQKPEACPHPKGWEPTEDWQSMKRKAENLLAWLQKNKNEDLCNIDLVGAQLAQANLSGAKLNGADLSEARLLSANLSGAKLFEANLGDAYLEKANLGDANLSGANLEKANLSGAKLSGADLRNAHLSDTWLSGANLSRAKLSPAHLESAHLEKATLSGADLSDAYLELADLSRANLELAHLHRATLGGATLSGADLKGADLSDADLSPYQILGPNHNRPANLSGAILSGADLSRANLRHAILNGVFLTGSKLDDAVLYGADLTGAHFESTSVAGAKLADTNLTEAVYAPVSAPPDPYVAGIQGLNTVTFLHAKPKVDAFDVLSDPVERTGNETGLVQLRDLLQKAGLRDVEREATFAIERGKTKQSLDDWKKNPAGAAEGVFRYAAFDLTTRYGMRPSRALLLIAALWVLLIPIYAWPIWQRKRPPTRAAIYRIWPKERLGVQEQKPALDTQERLHRRGLAAIGWAAYFSLLSAFQVGYREFSIGSWLSRAQPRDFTLTSTGWVRTVSGVQSLLSVYLLAMWVLTYFGRPFQ